MGIIVCPALASPTADGEGRVFNLLLVYFFFGKVGYRESVDAATANLASGIVFHLEETYIFMHDITTFSSSSTLECHFFSRSSYGHHHVVSNGGHFI